MAKFTFHVSTNMQGSKKEEIVEIPDDELEGLTETEIDKYIYKEYYQDWLNNNAELSFWREED